MLKIIEYNDSEKSHIISYSVKYPSVVGIVVKYNKYIYSGSVMIKNRYDSSKIYFTDTINCNFIYDKQKMHPYFNENLKITVNKKKSGNLKIIYPDNFYIYNNEKYSKISKIELATIFDKKTEIINKQNAIYKMKIKLDGKTVIKIGSRISILICPNIHISLFERLNSIGLYKYSQHEMNKYCFSNKIFEKVLCIKDKDNYNLYNYNQKFKKILSSDFRIDLKSKHFIGLALIISSDKNYYELSNNKSYLNKKKTNILPIKKNITRFNFFTKNPVYQFRKKSLTFQSGKYDFIKVFDSLRFILYRITPTTEALGEFYTSNKSSFLNSKIRLAIKDFWVTKKSNDDISIWPSKLYTPIKFLDFSNNWKTDQKKNNALYFISGIVGDQGSNYIGGDTQIYRFAGKLQNNSCYALNIGLSYLLQMFVKEDCDIENTCIDNKNDKNRVFKSIKNFPNYELIFKNLNKKNKIEFFNGDIYFGDIKENKMEGIGEYIWDDGEYYQGNFKNGLPNGIGIKVYNNNEIWFGYWKDGYRSGFGFIFTNESSSAAIANLIKYENKKWYYPIIDRLNDPELNKFKYCEL